MAQIEHRISATAYTQASIYLQPAKTIRLIFVRVASLPQDLEGQLAELAEALRRRNPDCLASLIRAARPSQSQEIRKEGKAGGMIFLRLRR